MRTVEVNFSLSNVRVVGECLVHFPPPPRLIMWDLPEVRYAITCQTRNSMESARLAWFNGAIPVDVASGSAGAVDEIVAEQAVLACMEFVAWGLNETWAVPSRSDMCAQGTAQLPSQSTFNAALFSLLSALLEGREEGLFLHHNLAAMLIPTLARWTSITTTGQDEEAAKNATRIQGYEGPFWIDAVRRIRNAKTQSGFKI